MVAKSRSNKNAGVGLGESNLNFRALADASMSGMIVFQAERIVYVNLTAAEIVGYTKDELLSMRFWDVIHPDFRDTVIEHGLNLLNGEPVRSRFEIKVAGKNGRVRWVDSFFTLIEYACRPALLVTAVDITERKQVEEALRESEASLAKAQRIAHIGSWEWDLTKNINKWSDETCHIFGIKPGEFSGNIESFLERVHPDDRARVREAGAKAIREKLPFSFDYRIILPDGTIRHVHNENEVVIDAGGKAIRLQGTAQDITDRKRFEEELKDAKAQAELYLDLMGHDINNMHQIALGYIELARDRHLDTDQGDLLDKPVEVLQRSARLIQNVRKLQKLRDGVFQTQDIDVQAVLTDVQREFGSVLNKTVSLNMNGCDHCHVRANEVLYDVFANLVGNAIKHTGDRADIVMGIDMVKDNGSRYCRVMVEDNGPGIQDDFKDKIFNRMLKSTSRAKGMGLGLYLVKSLVDSYHGKVWVEDRVPGDHTKGARFVVILPAVDK